MRKKPTFFERLTGALPADDYTDAFEEEQDLHEDTSDDENTENAFGVQNLDDEDDDKKYSWLESIDPEESELKMDVYETEDSIIVRSMIPGVNPDAINIALTRDMLTVSGTREEHQEVTKDEYFCQELFWGSFSRTVQLPAEVEVDEAEASEQHGMLILRLPKIDKDRQTTLKVKSK